MTDTITLPRSVVEQALEALKYERDANNPLDWHHDKTMTALRAALEQPQVEQPVAVVTGFYGGFPTIRPLEPATVLPVGMALYTHPQPPRQPLTDEAIDAIIKSNFVEITNQNLYDAIYLCMRDVEGAHEIEEQK